MFNGYEMWKPDVEACARYRIMNPAGSACGRCMKVCPFNKEGLMQYRAALWLAMHVPASHKLLIWLDDKLGFGSRTNDWKWWWDLEWKDGRIQRPKKTNNRDLRPERKAPARQNITFYGLDSIPDPKDRSPNPVRRTPKAKSEQSS